MPTELPWLALVYLFQWYGLACYWQFVAASLAKVDLGHERRTSDAPSGGGRMDRAGQRLVQHRDLLGGVRARRLRPTPRGQMVHSACLVLAAVGLLVFPHLTNR